MEPGMYIAIAKENLRLQESREYWLKGESYEAKVETDGVMRLTGEWGMTYYTPVIVGQIVKLFIFKRKQGM